MNVMINCLLFNSNNKAVLMMKTNVIMQVKRRYQDGSNGRSIQSFSYQKNEDITDSIKNICLATNHQPPLLPNLLIMNCCKLYFTFPIHKPLIYVTPYGASAKSEKASNKIVCVIPLQTTFLLHEVKSLIFKLSISMCCTKIIKRGKKYKFNFFLPTRMLRQLGSIVCITFHTHDHFDVQNWIICIWYMYKNSIICHIL